MDILSNPNKHNEEFDKIMASQSFKDFVKGKNAKALSKFVKEDNDKVYKAYVKNQPQPAAKNNNVPVNNNKQPDNKPAQPVKQETPLAK